MCGGVRSTDRMKNHDSIVGPKSEVGPIDERDGYSLSWTGSRLGGYTVWCVWRTTILAKQGWGFVRKEWGLGEYVLACGCSLIKFPDDHSLLGVVHVGWAVEAVTPPKYDRPMLSWFVLDILWN